MTLQPDSTPFLISWNVTRQCHLKCPHCYIDSTERSAPDEVSTAEAYGFIDKIAQANPDAMLIFTGGEPMLRADIYEIISYASDKGLFVTLGSSGHAIGAVAAKKLKSCGVRGAGISLDSATPDYHDEFRGSAGAWKTAISAIDELSSAGIDTQIHFTITDKNLRELEPLAELALRKKLRALNIFFTVCTGRAADQTDSDPKRHEETLIKIAELEERYRGRVMLRSRCAPIIVRVAARKDPESPLATGATSGCIAGRGYLRIAPNGAITPCPYIPEATDSPNLKYGTLKDLTAADALFKALAQSNYSGRCSDCAYSKSCSGCRARALSASGNIMSEDPLCDYEAEKNSTARQLEGDIAVPIWNPEAAERLERVPIFLRRMVKSGVERYAAIKSIKVITPEIMAELKKKAGV